MIMMMPVAGIMIYMQMRAAAPGGKAGTTPKAIIDSAAVKNELTALANAERGEFALEGKYNGNIDDLMKKSEFKLAPSDKAPYKYSALLTPTGLRVVATYAGPASSAAPATISIDETMEIKTQ
jgi:hypothetical protein